MKFRVTMKDPDSLSDAIDDAIKEELKSVSGLSNEEREYLFDGRHDAVYKDAGQWFKYGEYLTVEIDTDAGTAIVVNG